MIILNVKQGSEEWHDERKRRIGGTRLGDIWSARAYLKKDLADELVKAGIEFEKAATTDELEQMLPIKSRLEFLKNAPRKAGFYDLVAEFLAIDRDDENRMARGTRLEPEVRAWFAKTYNKRVEEAGMLMSSIDDRIYNSPDGVIVPKNAKLEIEDGLTIFPQGFKIKEAIEVKCLAPGRHIQAVLEKKVPEEYWSQMMQYFVVNEDLGTLYWIFHDPSIIAIPYYVLKITRESLGNWPQRLLEFQVAQLQRIDEIVAELAF